MPATALYPNAAGKLDIYATANSRSQGELNAGNTQSATYEIRIADFTPTRLRQAP